MSTGSAGWHVPAGFYTRKDDENKDGMSRGGAQVNQLVVAGIAMPMAKIARFAADRRHI
jgi:hypothetical protein